MTHAWGHFDEPEDVARRIITAAFRDKGKPERVVLPGIYDGIAAWRWPDGTITNLWLGIPGGEARAERIQEWIDGHADAATRPGSCTPESDVAWTTTNGDSGQKL